MEARIASVIDLAFGDFGKGVTVSNLVAAAQDSYCDTPLVIRYCGGPQAGHTVLFDGKRHIFSSFGSGTLQGAPTYFSQHTMFYMPNMLREVEVLNNLGVCPKLFLDPLAMVITPFDVAWNRATERTNNHGSCGLGIAATMERNLMHPCKLLAGDLYSSSYVLDYKVDSVCEYYDAKIALMPEATQRAFEDELEVVSADWESKASVWSSLPKLKETGKLDLSIASFEQVRKAHFPGYGEHHYIFEGAQGIMLDQDHGLHPHTTYGYCTHRNVAEILNSVNWGHYGDGISFEAYYGTRCYQTRHGAGPCGETAGVALVNNNEETNVWNEWQGEFRVSELDPHLLGAAYLLDQAYVSRITFPGALRVIGNYENVSSRNNIVLTCVDQRPDVAKAPHDFLAEMLERSYAFDDTSLKHSGVQWFNTSPETGHMHNRFGIPIGVRN